MRKKILLSILISAVLCGCGNSSEDSDAALNTSDTITAETQTEAYTETTTEKAISESTVYSEETSASTKDSFPHETISSAAAAASETGKPLSEESTVQTSQITAADTVQNTSSAVTEAIVTTAPSATLPAETTFKAADKDKYENAEDVVFSEYFSDSLFIGDSICSGLKIYSGCLNIENVAARLNVSTWGIDKYTFQYKSNSTSELDALSIVKLYQPKEIYIWMGMNDLYVVSADKYAENLCDLAQTYIDADPDCKVYAVSISPMSSTHSWNVEMDGNNRVNEYNKTVEEKCREVDYLNYINIHDCLTDSYGYLASENNGGDGIHLSASAYKKVLTEIYYYREYERKSESIAETEIVTEATISEADEETTVTTIEAESEIETNTSVTTAPPEETTTETESTESSVRFSIPTFEEIQNMKNV